MTWMLTATGAEVDLRFMAQPADISILDIAHHLAQINRYTGACSRPYSVAEHSLLVCDILERQLHITDPKVLMAGLMHDAHEAYTNDISSPWKQVLGYKWEVEEHRVATAVRQRFDLEATTDATWLRVKWADLTALSTEREQLLPPGTLPWPTSSSHPPLLRSDCDLSSRTEMTWDDWRHAFLDRFAELRFAIDQVADHEGSTP